MTETQWTELEWSVPLRLHRAVQRLGHETLARHDQPLTSAVAIWGPHDLAARAAARPPRPASAATDQPSRPPRAHRPPALAARRRDRGHLDPVRSISACAFSAAASIGLRSSTYPLQRGPMFTVGMLDRLGR